MTVFARCALAVAVTSLCCAPASADEVIRILRLNRPATGIAKSVADLYADSDDLRIVIDRESNALVIRGTEASTTRVIETIRELDRPQQPVTITVTMNVAGEGDEGTDEMTLTTLDEQVARLQFGQVVSVTEGVTNIGGRSHRSVSRQNVGTLVEVTPRIVGDTIALKLNAEKSWIESSEDSQTTPPTFTASLSTTITVTPGKPQTQRVRVNGVPAKELEITITASHGAPPLRGISDNRGGAGNDPRLESGRRPGGLNSGRGGVQQRFGGRGFRSPQPSPEARSQRLADAMFRRLDSNDDKRLSEEEWNSESGMAKSLAERGFEFADNMTPEQFAKQISGVMNFTRGSTSPSRQQPGGRRPVRPGPDGARTGDQPEPETTTPDEDAEPATRRPN